VLVSRGIVGPFMASGRPDGNTTRADVRIPIVSHRRRRADRGRCQTVSGVELLFHFGIFGSSHADSLYTRYLANKTTAFVAF
jgi:hypothetical protein